MVESDFDVGKITCGLFLLSLWLSVDIP